MGRRLLAFPRLLVLALLLAAVVPTLSVGILTSLRLSDILASDAEGRAATAAEAAASLLSRERADLRRLADSYAGWFTLQEEIRRGRLDAVKADVLDFLVQQGTVDQAGLAGPNLLLASGISDVPLGGGAIGRAATLFHDAGVSAAGAEPGGAAPAPSLAPSSGPASPSPDHPSELIVTLADGVYVATVRPLGGLAPEWWILLARRLDARFALDVRRLTGFDAALLGADGRLLVATDPVVAAAVAPLVGRATGSGTARTSDAVAAVLPLQGPDGRVSARLVVSTQLQAVEAAGGQLPALVAVSAISTVVLAILLAVALSGVLNRRLRAVHDGLVAVAEGRIRLWRQGPTDGSLEMVPAAPPLAPAAPRTGGGDVADRLQAALAALVTALDRRETILHRCLEAAGRIPIADGPEVAGRAAVGEVVRIFGLVSAAIVDPQGRLLAESGGGAGAVGNDGRASSSVEPAPEAGDRVVEAPLDLGGGGWRLVARLGDSSGWEPADEDALRIMALLVGTVLRDAEQYQRAARRAAELDRLNVLQRDFLRSVSHNLQTPLATISLAAEDLSEVPSDPFVASRAAAIRAESTRLRRLVDQVVTLSRLEAGTIRLEGEVVHVVRAAERVWGELGSDRPFAVTAEGETVWALADPAAVEQILWILLDNAVRHGEGAVRVEVKTVRGRPAVSHAPTERGMGVRLLVAVRDQGPGVPAAERRRIFQRFAGSHRDGGLGLGLSLARSLARAMGGDLRYRGRTRGACFILELPGLLVEPLPSLAGH